MSEFMEAVSFFTIGAGGTQAAAIDRVTVNNFKTDQSEVVDIVTICNCVRMSGRREQTCFSGCDSNRVAVDE
jgi:hypothetical protein